MDRRDGYHCFSGCYPADVRYRWHAAFSSWNSRPNEIQQTNSPHKGNSKSNLVYLFGTHYRLCNRLLAGWHEYLWCHISQLFNSFSWRIFNTRQKPWLFWQCSYWSCCSNFYVTGRSQLCATFQGMERSQPEILLPRCRITYLPGSINIYRYCCQHLSLSPPNPSWDRFPWA